MVRLPPVGSASTQLTTRSLSVTTVPPVKSLEPDRIDCPPPVLSKPPVPVRFASREAIAVENEHACLNDHRALAPGVVAKL